MSSKNIPAPAEAIPGFTLQDWATSDAAEYNREAVYKALIAPLVEQIADLCIEHQIPMYYVACHSQAADGSNNCHTTTHLVSKEDVPAEVLVHDFPETALTRDAIGYVAAVVHGDEVRIDRFYKHKGSKTH